MIIFLFSNEISAQENTKKNILPEFKELQNKINTSKDSSEGLYWAKKYIISAKKKGNTHDLLSAYEYATLFSPDSLSSKYSDSILNLSVKIKDQILIGNTYYLMATKSYGKYDYKNASEFAVISYDYFITEKAENLAKRSLFNIARLKFIVGDHDSAKKILHEQYLYFKNNQKDFEDKLWYISYLSTLILVNAKLEKPDENVKLLRELNDFYMSEKNLISGRHLLDFSYAGNDYYLGNYDSAIRIMKKIKLSVGSQKTDGLDFYLAMCYWKMGNINKAFPIFENIKKNFLKTKKTSLEFRPTFDFFTEYYKKHGTTEQQLASLNDLLEFDKYEEDVKNYVQLKLKDFDEKHQNEEQLLSDDQQKFSNWLSIAIISLSSFVVVYFVYRRIKGKKETGIPKILEILENPNEISERPKAQGHIKETSENTEIDYSLYRPMNKFTVNQILAFMKIFESSSGFLEQDLKLTALAQKFNTNEKYLSKVIKVNLGKTFNAYLTDLRFEYLDEKLKTDFQFKNQKIKEISVKLGFGSPEFFATAFKEKYGKSPKEYFDI
ncbi:helix-turn-helix domain-containing protein [Chryseobacterium foetidum]|uniref:helix-turn-helix domain-containing protein n=1 Tax=Chryseobacterium foetidum TaxID=2951057 RepID=UPI0021C7E905|nr:helix-turn-helix transcriptional regulator [Chryseobacterium foetidum]